MVNSQPSIKPTAATTQAYAAMEQQLAQDDTELGTLKKKLTMMKQMEQPENKEEMIAFLMKRLQAAEEAIMTSEEIILHERNYRKTVS